MRCHILVGEGRQGGREGRGSCPRTRTVFYIMKRVSAEVPESELLHMELDALENWSGAFSVSPHIYNQKIHSLLKVC